MNKNKLYEKFFNMQLIRRPILGKKIIYIDKQHSIVVLIANNIVPNNDDFLETVVDLPQRTQLLLHFVVIGNTVGRLDIIPSIAYVANKIDFQLLADVFAIQSLLSYHYASDS